MAKARVLRAVRSWLPVVLLVMGVTTFRTGYADWSSITTGSMEPTLLPGDYIWIDKTAFGPSLPFANKRLIAWGAPERGDIITFVPPHTDDLYVKRVIGVPGDVVHVTGRDVFVNGERLAASYYRDDSGVVRGTELIGGSTHGVQLSGVRSLPVMREPAVVPERRYFVLGDHRDNSLDSRAWGWVDEDQIMGRATHIAVSFSRQRPLRERLAHALR